MGEESEDNRNCTLFNVWAVLVSGTKHHVALPVSRFRYLFRCGFSRSRREPKSTNDGLTLRHCTQYVILYLKIHFYQSFGLRRIYLGSNVNGESDTHEQPVNLCFNTNIVIMIKHRYYELCRVCASVRAASVPNMFSKQQKMIGDAEQDGLNRKKKRRG